MDSSNDTITTQPSLPHAGKHPDSSEAGQAAAAHHDGGGAAKPPGEKRGHKALKRVAAVVLALAACVTAGVCYLKFIAPYESTDDAFIAAHVIPVAPQVAGRVTQVFGGDNQEVREGDVLLQIDPVDYQTKLEQARAALAASQSRLAQAVAQLAADRAAVEQEKASVTVAEARAKQADADNRRYQAVGNSAASQSQLDLAASQARSADAEVQAARNKELAAEAQVGLAQANIQTAKAEIQSSQANVRQAGQDLSYTRVKAPQTGYVTHRTVEVGAYVKAGQALMALVPRQVWVVANFKETQLTRMRPGQPVRVKVDAYPRVTFHGHVDSIQRGSGASFSLLPPENASGNYVKVVQRVPVKILIDDADEAGFVLGPGMSVEPEVRVGRP